MPSIVYLVTGANRGLGLAIVKELARREGAIVFAGVRDISTASDINALAKESAGKVHVIKLTSGDQVEHNAAIEKIKEISGRLDVVIANAGIFQHTGPSLEVPPQVMRDHFEVNTIGPLVLFQAAYSLLQASTPTPKFIVMSATGGSITSGSQFPELVAYGTSKAAVNYVTRKLHFEHDNLVAFSICPGLVDTDMANFILSRQPTIESSSFVMKTSEETSVALVNLIDSATREKYGGSFTFWNDSRIEW